MTAVYVPQPVFSRGEISPKLHSRADLDLFKMGLDTCFNWIVQRQGGLARRAGTGYVQFVKNQNRPAKIIPFIFSASQAYMLVFNAGVFRVYTLGGRVGTVEVAHPYADADLFQLDFDQTNDVLDITHKAYQPRRVKRQSDTSWSIDTVPARDGPYLPLNDTATKMTPSATGNIVPNMTSNTSPAGYVAASSNATAGFSAFNAFDTDPSTKWKNPDKSGWISLQFPSSHVVVGYSIQAGTAASTTDPNDVASLNAPKSWTWEGSNDGSTWNVIDSQFAQSSWSSNETRFYRVTNTTAYLYYRLNVVNNNGGSNVEISTIAMLEEPTLAPAITLTASGTDGINNGAGFMANDVGRFITLLGSDATWHPFQIVGFTSTTVVTVKAAGAPLIVARSTIQWRFGAWGDTPGWPAHVCTFEGRKIFARTNAQPNGIWGTRANGYGSFLDFSTNVPLQDDDAISFVLADVNEIQWIAEGPDLFIGTAGAARIMGRDSPNLPFSANNYRQSLASTYASQNVRPTKVGGSTIFVAAFGRAVREFTQADSGVGYDTTDITVLSEHLFSSGVIELAYAQEPDSIVWNASGNGELVGMTYEKAQAMAAVHHHQMGGGGVVESAAVIPGDGRHELWLIVLRTIGGVTKRYIERMAPTFDAKTMSPSNAWYVDCGLQYTGAPVTTVSGLDHLEGMIVSILADGAREADQVVTGGSVSLASGRAASNIIVGLPYRSFARTLRSPISSGDGSGLGRRKKVVSSMIDLLNSGPVQVGRDTLTMEQINFRSTVDPLGAAPPLASGFLPAYPETSWGDGGQLDVVVDGPQPCTIRNIVLALESEP